MLSKRTTKSVPSSKSLRFWKGRCEQGIYDMFPLLADFLTVTETSTSTHLSTVLNDIQQLSHYFHEYFGDDDTRMFDWIRNPFECQLTDRTGREQEDWLDCRLTGLRICSSTECPCCRSG